MCCRLAIRHAARPDKAPAPLSPPDATSESSLPLAPKAALPESFATTSHQAETERSPEVS